jgi:hypothetical protein
MTPDLELLRKHARKLQPVFDEIELRLVDDPAWAEPSDHGSLSAKERNNPDIAANVEATNATNELISWFAHDSRGYVGLWRGPANHSLVDAPIVVLDTEGQYRIRATTVPDYLVVVTRDGVFTDVRKQLVAVGFKVSRSRDAIYASCDACPDAPNDYRNELYEIFRRAKKKKKKPASKRKR